MQSTMEIIDLFCTPWTIKEISVVPMQDGGASTADGLTDMQTLVTYGGIFQGPDAQLSADFVQIAPHYEANDTNDTQNYQCTIETCLGTTDTNSTDPAESWSSPGINEGYGFAYYIGDTFPLFQRCYLTQEVRKVVKSTKASARTFEIELTVKILFFHHPFPGRRSNGRIHWR
jgi:hypothetical protein